MPAPRSSSRWPAWAADGPRVSPADEALLAQCRAMLEDRLHLLPDKPEETVATTLAALWHAAAGAPRSAATALEAPLAPLDEGQAAALRTLVERRLEGIPLAHLTGLQRFMGLDLAAGPAALIPRRETEILGALALARLREACDARGSAVAIDVCTGSGNLALALAHHEPRARVYAADLSGEAVELARDNAKRLGLEARVTFAAGDLLAPFARDPGPDAVDLVCCNPPYISSAKVAAMDAEIARHEPALAFDGGPLGIRILDRVVREALPLLRPGGWLAFEVGAGQGRGLRRRVEQRGDYEGVLEASDATGEVRAIAARRKSP